MPEPARRYAVKAGVAIGATAAGAGRGLLSERAENATADSAIFSKYVAYTLATSHSRALAMPFSDVLLMRAELCMAVRRSCQLSLLSASPRTSVLSIGSTGGAATIRAPAPRFRRGSSRLSTIDPPRHAARPPSGHRALVKFHL